jgi:hypothetical protein
VSIEWTLRVFVHLKKFWQSLEKYFSRQRKVLKHPKILGSGKNLEAYAAQNLAIRKFELRFNFKIKVSNAKFA